MMHKKQFFLFSLGGSMLTIFSAVADISAGGPQNKVEKIYYAESSAAGAANELAEYLEKIFQKKFQVSKKDTVDEPAFYIGKALAPSDAPVATHREQYFQTVTPNGRIHLWGAESTKNIPGDYRAVEDFLRRECEVRWLWPGELGEVVPCRKELKMPVGTHSEKPAFQVRVLKYRLDPIWARRMRLGQSIDYQTGHSFSKWFPPQKYFAGHPEYYGLVSPENWVGGGNKPDKPTRVPLQLCTSNPEVRSLLAKKLAAKDTDVMQSISPNDGYGFCECAECRKMDRIPWTSIHEWPDLSPRMYDFTRDVAVQAKKLNPKTKVLLNAYTFCKNPPENMEKMPDNVFVLKCLFGVMEKDRKKIEQEFETYRKLGVGLWIYEYWGTYNQNMPWNLIHMISWECKLLKKTGGWGMRVENTADFANAGINNYIGSMLLWNPDLNVDELLDDYCSAAFGPAAEKMKEYYNLLERHTETLSLQSGGSYISTLSGIPEVYDKSFFQEAERIFSGIRNVKLSKDQADRVAFVKTGLEYGRVVSEWAAMLRKVNAAGGDLPLVLPSRKELSRLDDAELDRLFTEADNACEAKRKMMVAEYFKNNHALEFDDRLDRTLWHMPYQMLIQHLKMGVEKGFFNYFINNAFELRANAADLPPGRLVYGWITEGATPALDLSDCHDDIHNVTAMYHGKQGQSLRFDLKPGEKAELENVAKVVLSSGVTMKVSGWFKGGEPEAEVRWDIDGNLKTERLSVAVKGLKEKTGWREITFEPFKVPEGKSVTATIRFTVENKTEEGMKIFFDNLKFEKAR